MKQKAHTFWIGLQKPNVPNIDLYHLSGQTDDRVVNFWLGRGKFLSVG